ncbi:MAG: cupin-like domain-containing protein [Planctomycetota bacterium]
MNVTASPAAATPTRTPESPWLRPETVGVESKAAFPTRPFAVRHELVGHPLLTVEGLLALVDRVPAKHVDWHPADVDLDHVGRPPKPPADPRQLLREIETAKAWLGLDKVQGDPEVRDLSHAFLSQALATLPDRVGRIHKVEANFFVSSPGARKPIHMDPEHNFLLQVRGTKTVHLWDVEDREIVPESLLEAFATTADWAGLPVKRKDKPPTCSFHLEPGTGVYFPVYWPHAVENGTGEASISASFTFHSDRSRRTETIRQMNAKLRRLGLSPRAPGASRLADRLKLGVMATARGLKNLVR